MGGFNLIFSLMRKYIFWMFFILSAVLLQSPKEGQAVQQETRIPAGVSMARFQLISKPAYTEAYNGYGKRVPLKWLLIKYGGIKKYQQARPFFLGLILGEYTFGSIWTIIGNIINQQNYPMQFWVII